MDSKNNISGLLRSWSCGQRGRTGIAEVLLPVERCMVLQSGMDLSKFPTASLRLGSLQC